MRIDDYVLWSVFARAAHFLLPLHVEYWTIIFPSFSFFFR